MKQILLSLLILAATLASCSNDSFKIDGDITNLDGTTVKVVFRGDSGIIDSMVSVDKKGHFKFKGQSAQPVVVSLLNHSNQHSNNLRSSNLRSKMRHRLNRNRQLHRNKQLNNQPKSNHRLRKTLNHSNLNRINRIFLKT